MRSVVLLGLGVILYLFGGIVFLVAVIGVAGFTPADGFTPDSFGGTTLALLGLSVVLYVVGAYLTRVGRAGLEDDEPNIPPQYRP